MGDAIRAWKDTRGIVLIALVAALYAAALIPSKPITLIPGITEIRPGTAIPIVFSFLFGAVAGWGAALGNLLGDFFGTFGPGSIPGMAGNFLLGLLPYQVYRALPGGAKPGRGAEGIGRFLVSVIVASAACAFVVGWGVDRLGLVPFRALATVILVHNVVVGMVIGLPLYLLLAGRVRTRGPELEPVSALRARAGLLLVVASLALGFVSEFRGGIASGPIAIPGLVLGVLLL